MSAVDAARSADGFGTDRRVQPASKPVLALVGASGSGKTTLLVKLLPRLNAQGLRIGVIKHTHHDFDIDLPGKDSYELRKAGAAQILIGGSQRWALIVKTKDRTDAQFDDSLRDDFLRDDFLRQLKHEDLDLILVEGFRSVAVPKIEIYRPMLGTPPMGSTDAHRIAVATDQPHRVTVEVPVLDLNDPDAIAGFITERVYRAAAGQAAALPALP